MFGLGQNNQQGGSTMFGQSTNQPAGTGPFGSSLGGNNQQGQQQGSGFGQFGQTQNQQPQQTGGGIFGSGLGNNQQQNNQQQQQQTGFGLGQNTQQNQGGGIFGLGQNNQQQNNQPQSQPTSLFGNPGNAPRPLFQSSVQQLAQSQPQLGQSNSALWQSVNSITNPREKSIPEQISAIMEQWDPGNPNCAFSHYFYNKVPDEAAPFFRPGPNEDPKKWEEALSKKPGPGYIPVLCTGFEQIGERIKTQQTNLTQFNFMLHSINDCLTLLLQNHDTKTSIRAMDAKRKHVVLKQRCLALATKVQILRNRGYAMGGDEEDLRTKLLELEKGVSDPGLGARAEEIWARMITVQERAKLLRAEIEKSGTQSLATLDEVTEQRAKKILEDYQTQLVHLKKELDKIQEDFVEWEKSQPQMPAGKDQ